ncbi:sugar-binding transcriptional regulator [Limimaricola cinnabarinus]|uniref:Transcriptional regulator n=1 Tax=Limimaricola cinnabarinus LL-001 TaxID=1337093 RepID=U3ACG4_9RHOB|nr:sugar-binding transcriptional regulator [Limimaricola cinnabarinus]GAD55339.1 transcriptional regulator [Limimaricola cinnabarinus LL-001]
MAGNDSTEDLRTRVAWLYYAEGMTQDEVAQAVGLTRARVLRILANARADGTVQIRVTTKMSRCVELERRLEEKWGLDRAIVIPDPQDQALIPKLIGQELGAMLSQEVRPDTSIGLGWGQTLTSGVPSIEPRDAAGVKVVSLLGGLTRVEKVNPSEFAWRVADRLSAECYLMAGPVFAPTSEIRDALLAHPGIAEIIERAGRLDLAILSLGDLTPHSIFVQYGLLSSEEIASLERAGAVGDVLCHFVDAEGQVVDHPVNRRVLAVDPRDLRSSRRIVLASGGWQKVTIIRAALRMLSPAMLITDETVAARLCES